MRRALIVTWIAGCGRLDFAPAEVIDATVAPDVDGARLDLDAPRSDAAHPDASPRACTQTYTQTIAARPDRTYRVAAAAQTWTDAAAECAAEGAHLPVPLDAVELAQVYALTSFPAWLGLTDAALEGDWRTELDGSAPFLAFVPGQPDGSFEACDCIRLNSNGMDDFPCGGALEFACECPP